MIYGPEGIGKSTFASKFPDPVFIDTEYDTWNMDPVATGKSICTLSGSESGCTAHLYGTPGKVDEIRNV